METTKQKNYQQAFELACTSLRGMDLEERAGKAGAFYEDSDGRKKIVVHFLSEPYHLHLPEFDRTSGPASPAPHGGEFHIDSPGKKTVSLVIRVLLLHYLLGADGFPLAGRWIAYKEIPGGLLYSGVFARRVTEPLVQKFGMSARGFQEAGSALGGTPAGVGDASFLLQALPHVPLQYVLWEGDEDFPPSVQLLFDASVHHYLSLEDIVVLGQVVTGRLIHRSRINPEETPHRKED